MKLNILMFCLFIFLCKIVVSQNFAPVSLYAHNNQAVYSLGETVHSKIYIKTPSGLLMQPMNVYVDWYSADGKLISHQIYLSKFGGTESSFSIPLYYAFSFLRMRMYTLNSLEQSAETRFSDQVVFVHQPTFNNKVQIDSSSFLNPIQTKFDKSIIVNKIIGSFDPKGKSEWEIENISEDFINLSISIVEEESFEQPPYNILKHFNKNFLSNSTIKANYNDAFVQVKGKLIADTNLLKNASLSFSLFKPGQLPIIDKVPIKLDGSFLIDQLNFFDSAQISIQVDYIGKRKQKIPLSYQQIGLFTSAPLFAFDFKDSLPEFRFAHKSFEYVPYEKQNTNEVVVYSNVKSTMEAMDKKYTNGLFRGGDAINFNLLTPEVSAFPTIFHYLMGKVPGMQISFGPDTSNGLSGIWGIPVVKRSGNYGDEVKFFLNEFLIKPERLLDLNINEIAYVKVFRPPFLGAPMGAPSGAIAIYTKLGDDYNFFPRDSKLTSFIVKGFTSLTPFVQPDYSSEKKRAVIDRRKTLLWLPTIHMNQNTKAERFVYYNNDRSKKHRIIIEGVKRNGQLIRKEWVVE